MAQTAPEGGRAWGEMGEEGQYEMREEMGGDKENQELNFSTMRTLTFRVGRRAVL